MNVDRYARRAHAKKKGLALSMKKLVKKNPSGILKDAKTASDMAWNEVSCIACGHCCKKMTPTWKKQEVKRIAQHVGMSYEAYFEKYLYVEEETGDIMNKSTPCQHYDLKKGLCSVYEWRPHDCSEFPHFHRKDFLDQMDEVFIPNMPRCPATLVMIEKLEAIMKSKQVIK